jgi:hypothetical protein
MCVIKNPKSLHNHKINRHLPTKHLHLLKMRNRLKMMKIRRMSHLKRRTMIKEEDNDEDKEDEQKIQGQRPPHP